MLIEAWHRHQLLDRCRLCRHFGISFTSNGLDGLEDAGVFNPRKIVEDFRFLAQRGVGSHSLARDGNRSGSHQVLGKNELQQTAVQPKQSNFRVLHPEYFRQHHTDLERGYPLAQHRSEREQIFGKNDLFDSSIFRLLGHRMTLEFNLPTALKSRTLNTSPPLQYHPTSPLISAK